MKNSFLLICFIILSLSNTGAQTWEELNEKVIQYYNEGDYAQAISYAEQALEQCEIEYGKEHQNYATSLSELAGLYFDIGHYEDALPLYLEALENTENRLGKDHSEYGVSLNDLALLYFDMGRYEEALPLYLESLENIEKNLGKDHSYYGISLSNIAQLYATMGRYEEALPLYLESLENTEKSLGKDHPDYGIRLNNLASLYQAMGRYEEALPLYLEALENIEKSLGKDHSQYGTFLNNLAGLYQLIGRYEEALPLYLEVLENTEKSLGKDHYYYGISLNNIAKLYQVMGRYEEALPLYLESLENIEKSLGKDHYYYGFSLNNIAELSRKMGRYEEALPLCLEALENIEKSLGKDHSNYGRYLNNLALLYETIGQYEEALPLYLEANSNLHNQIRNIFSFSSEKEKEAFLKTLSNYFELYQSFHFTTSGQYSEMSALLYNNQLILKGLILASSENILDAIRVTTELYDQWIGIKRRLAEEYSKPITERVSYLDSLEAEANKMEGQLVSLSKDFMTEKKKEEITWKDVQKRLYRGDVAIEFASFRYYDKEWTDSTLYVAYVVTTETDFPEMVYLFEEKELNELLKHRAPNKIYALRGTELITTTESEYSREDLYSLIIKPLEKHLEGKERIYFSTDGKLHQFSFAAFSTKNGELLCDKYKLVQLNSTGQLALDNKIPGKEPVLLIGGIEFEYMIDQTVSKDSSSQFANNILEDESIKRSRSNHNRGEDWNYLPGTRAEVEKLIELFKTNGLSADTLTGSYATEESIKKLDGNSPKVLHLATHGFFFENPESRDKERKMASFGEKQSYSISEDPLMRSGLILAGGNYAWKNGSNPYESEDGILTAYEISNLNLLKTDLVVLSACETGLGDIEGSEGVYGLQRAFRMAGVENIIMSLWQVPDEETVEFMETFYGNWIGGDEIREAFNNTQKVMSKKYLEEPEKWAAFVLLE